MDNNMCIGFVLIAAIIIGFSFINRPSKEELAERQRMQDSIAAIRAMEQEAILLSEKLAAEQARTQNVTTPESAEALAEQVAALYGPFAPSAIGEEGTITIENEKVRLAIALRGGRIAKAELKEYKAYGDSINNLCLFQGEESHLSFTLITNNSRILSTENLYFTVVSQSTDNEGTTTLAMRLNTNIEDCYMDFVYTLAADDYMVDMSIHPHNM